jgi:8-oxo-dGTP pyrophosphatase MutT (NUDIX family)
VHFCPITKQPVPFGGYWSVFAGAIEDGETAEQAAVREVKEESDIDIQEKGLHLLGKIRDLALFVYKLEKLESVKLNFEHTESGYFKIPEIHTSPDPIDMDIARAIQYHNFINS